MTDLSMCCLGRGILRTQRIALSAEGVVRARRLAPRTASHRSRLAASTDPGYNLRPEPPTRGHLILSVFRVGT